MSTCFNVLQNPFDYFSKKFRALRGNYLNVVRRSLTIKYAHRRENIGRCIAKHEQGRPVGIGGGGAPPPQ